MNSDTETNLTHVQMVNFAFLKVRMSEVLAIIFCSYKKIIDQIPLTWFVAILCISGTCPSAFIIWSLTFAKLLGVN